MIEFYDISFLNKYLNQNKILKEENNSYETKMNILDEAFQKNKKYLKKNDLKISSFFISATR